MHRDKKAIDSSVVTSVGALKAGPKIRLAIALIITGSLLFPMGGCGNRRRSGCCEDVDDLLRMNSAFLSHMLSRRESGASSIRVLESGIVSNEISLVYNLMYNSLKTVFLSLEEESCGQCENVKVKTVQLFLQLLHMSALHREMHIDDDALSHRSDGEIPEHISPPLTPDTPSDTTTPSQPPEPTQ